MDKTDAEYVIDRGSGVKVVTPDSLKPLILTGKIPVRFEEVVRTCHDRTLFVDRINVFSLRITGIEPDNRTLSKPLVF